MQPAVPLDDASRVAALRRLGLLDQPPATDFEALTRLALTVTGAAMAAIDLIDIDRRWTAAATGTTPVELPREHAMCAYAVAADEAVAVADASVDPRFADCPEVADGRARMYVGIPLRTIDGYPVGTLCVLDPTARQVTGQQLAALRDIAGQAERLLELRRQHAELAELLAETGHAAAHDPVTGLANRRLFVDRLDHAIARAARTGRWPIVAFCDVDGLAALNERFGSETGDAALIAVGDRLQAGVRALDTVARLGSDEFAVLCEDTTEDDLASVQQRLRAVLALVRVDETEGIPVLVSLGAVRAAPGATAQSVIREAAREMCRSKLTARGGAVPPQASSPA